MCALYRPARPPSPPLLTRAPSPGSRDTLNNLILKVAPTHQIVAANFTNAPWLTFPCLCFAQSPQNWQTSIGLPFFQIQGTVVEWGPRIAWISKPASQLLPSHAHALSAPAPQTRSSSTSA